MLTTVDSRLTRLLGGVDPDARRPVSFTLAAPGGPRKGVFDPYNLRLKLYGLDPSDFESEEVRALRPDPTEPSALFSKLTLYTRPGGDWEAHGFRREGVIHRYFADGADADLWAAYGDPERARSDREAEHEKAVAIAVGKACVEPALPEGYSCRIAGPDDAAALAGILEAVFDDYPTPLTPGDVRAGIESRANHFRMILDPEGTLVAAASAELDHDERSAEMTDCATLPEQRGRGLMGYILWRLEGDLPELFDIRDLYTLARADETGMNCAFSKLGYTYTGRLVNNCRMPNGWESMNVWCKPAGTGIPDAPDAL